MLAICILWLISCTSTRTPGSSTAPKYYPPDPYDETGALVWEYDAERERLLKQFETRSLKGFGINNLHNAIVASAAVLFYLDITQHTQISHITSISRIEENKYVRLDRFTIRNLEIVDSMADEGTALLDVVNRTVSPMGARLLRRWLLFPLKDRNRINDRLSVVESLFKDPQGRELLHKHLETVGDMERLVSKVAVGRISPRETVQLKNALRAIAPIKDYCEASDNPVLRSFGDQLNPCTLIRDRIEREINPDAPNATNRGKVVRDGVDSELDELREIAYSGKDYLVQLQQRESEATGILFLSSEEKQISPSSGNTYLFNILRMISKYVSVSDASIFL